MEQLAVLKKLSALSNTPGIGAISAKKLVDQYGGINALFDFDNKKATGLQHDKVENLRQAIGHTYRSQDNHLRHLHKKYNQADHQLADEKQLQL